ncbi:MAG: NADH:flavin oxidoreductase [Eubacteriales bacterium]|nr:NADH:flavin oxidoreductase [Eubacteriales bacterium]
MHLFRETTIGGIKARNHFIRSATGEGKATEDGYPTEQIKNVYVNIAKNEVGVIVTSLTSVAGYEQASRNQLSIDRDEMITAYREVTDAVHAEGGKIVMQLFHGSSTSQAYPYNAKILGPSAIPNPYSGLIPKEMTEGDMNEVSRLFADAAVRAKKAGFDGVQLHGAHSCLLSQFLSPVYNRRTDQYGGSRENRYRFAGQVYQSVREAVGNDYPVWIKLDSTDGYADGLSAKDFVWTSRQLADAGMDAIEVSGMVHLRLYRGAYYREAAEMAADQISADVILTGGVRSLEDMQDICNESKVQFFGMSRPFLSYPDYILRLKTTEEVQGKV